MLDVAPKVFVVDDEESIRRALARLIATWDYQVESFDDPMAFLEAPWPAQACCANFDIRMPGLDGLQLQAEMAKRGRDLPIIFLTGHGDIPTTVEAMRHGAVDFLEKPVDEAVLQAAVGRALELSLATLDERNALEEARQHLDNLSPREYQTLRCVISGAPNKVIAYRLGITERTVKAHRRQVMEKMEVHSVAELVRMVERLGVEPDAGS